MPEKNLAGLKVVKSALKADSASHLVRHPINFELFFLLYLICVLLLQKINIYKNNYHRMDLNLIIFVVVVLSRRLAWCALQYTQMQSKSKTKASLKLPTWQSVFAEFSKGNLSWFALWNMFIWNWSLNVKRLFIVLCTIPAALWSVLQLMQNTPVFNLLFLFYPLLLYFSLFGLTLEPRCYREHFKPPNTFLQSNFMSPTRQTPPLFASSLEILVRHGRLLNSHTTTTSSVNLHSKMRHRLDKSDSSAFSITGSHHTDKLNSSQLHQSHTHRLNTSKDRPKDSSASSLSKKGTTSDVHYENGIVSTGKISNDHSGFHNSSDFMPMYACIGMEWRQAMCKYGPEMRLLLPSTPDEVRNEINMLMSDLVVRLKQLLFNSLLCAYYIGFIPMQFADGHLYYDKWWCVEHAFLVWANTFVILSSHLLPPSYCQLLYQCSLHLGYWSRCSHTEDTHVWSPDVTWLYNKVVQMNGEFFRAGGPQNVAIPCDSSHQYFYALFHSRLQVYTWLLLLQIVILLFLFFLLAHSIFWFQILSMSVFMIFNYFIFYKLLFNRLWCRRTVSLS